MLCDRNKKDPRVSPLPPESSGSRLWHAAAISGIVTRPALFGVKPESLVSDSDE